MTAWQAFVLGCLATLAIEALIRAALWIANSRPLAEPMEDAPGDWPHMDGR